MSRNIFFGDSVTSGGLSGQSTGEFGAGYPFIFSSFRGEECVDKAIAGSTSANLIYTAGQLSLALYGTVPQVDDRFFIMIGTNDRIQRGFGAGALALFKAALLAEVYWLASNKVVARDAAWTFTGTWANDWPGLTVGKYSATVGSKASVAFDGDVLAFGYVLMVAGGSFSVTVDGVSKGTFSSVAPANPSVPPFNQGASPALLRIAGCGSGVHVAEFTVVSAATILLDWVWTGANDLPVHLLTIPRCDPANYPSSDAGVAAYNATIADVAALAVADGLNVSVIDVSSRIDPLSADLMGDGVHPSNRGHLNIVGLLNAVLA